MNQITENEVYLILKENFPKQNDFNFLNEYHLMDNKQIKNLKKVANRLPKN